MILAPKNKEEIINLLGSLTEKEKNNMVLMAARTHQYISLQLLIEHIPFLNINCRDSGRTTALMLACIKGNVGIVRLLLENGAKVNLKNTFGTTALMQASFYGNREIVECLIEHGAKKELKDRSNETALNYCQRGSTRGIKWKDKEYKQILTILRFEYLKD